VAFEGRGDLRSRPRNLDEVGVLDIVVGLLLIDVDVLGNLQVKLSIRARAIYHGASACATFLPTNDQAEADDTAFISRLPRVFRLLYKPIVDYTHRAPYK